MKYLFTFIFILMLFTFKASAQQNTTIKEAANRIADATTKGDYATFVEFIYPKLVIKSGGKDSMIMITKMAYDNLKNKGIVLRNVKMGEPGELIILGNKQFSIVPQKIFLEMDKKIYNATSSNLAISEDNGKTWYFMALNEEGEDNLIYEFFPELKGKIAIPKSTKPVLDNL